MQGPKLKSDAQFHNNAARSTNREHLRKIIQTKFSSLSSQQIATQLERARIAFAHVRTMQDVWNHPQLLALNRFIEFDTPAGPVIGLRPPGNDSSFEPVITAVPDIGEHTREILQELGFAAAEIETFYRDEVV